MAINRTRGPAQPIMRECDHCGGDGEVQVFCDDCGDELYTDAVAASDPDICKSCEKIRKENEAEDAAIAAKTAGA